MEQEEIQRSIRYLPPYKGESFSHYLGRWKRKESIKIAKTSHLSNQLGLGTKLGRWERLYFNPLPNDDELARLGEIMDLEVEELRLLFPPEGERINSKTIRLCAACYEEKPYHRLAWQFESTAGCEIHKLRLLSSCIGCGEKFAIPVEWKGKCKRCKLEFEKMKRRQKRY